MPAELPHRRLTDPRQLRAMAHPLRVRLLEELAFDGPLTATQLSERLDESPANCSWHLRQLARFGYVEEAEGGTGRRRPWRIVVQSHGWGESDDPVEAAAGRAVSDVLDSRDNEEREAWLRREGKEPEEWREAAFGTHSFLWLTADELHDLGEAIYALLTEHVERFAEPSTRPPGSRPVRFMAWGFPTRSQKEES